MKAGKQRLCECLTERHKWFEVDPSGSWCFSFGRDDLFRVYASIDWEQEGFVTVQAGCFDGRHIPMVDHPFKLTGNTEEDYRNYMEIVRGYFPKEGNR